MAMITVHCINARLQRFDKEFNDLKSAKTFIIKCGYSRNICIEGYDTTSMSCDEELSKVYKPSRLLLQYMH